jgi:hypothetical protein
LCCQILQQPFVLRFVSGFIGTCFNLAGRLGGQLETKNEHKLHKRHKIYAGLFGQIIHKVRCLVSVCKLYVLVCLPCQVSRWPAVWVANLEQERTETHIEHNKFLKTVAHAETYMALAWLVGQFLRKRLFVCVC